MSKTKIKNMRRDSLIRREEVYAHYMAKYFNLFLNRFSFEGDITDEERAFVMRQFWANGTVACFKMAGSEGSEDFPNGKPVFTPYAVNTWNIYHYPVTVSLVALQGVNFIPLTPQKVDEEAVIGWAQRNKEPIVRVVDYYARKLTSVDMVLQVNLQVQKFPWIIGTSPEGAEKSRAMAELLLRDDPTLFLELEEIDKAKALISGAPYVIDKLYNYKTNLENELREYLGLSNLGIGEKKEHLLMDEIAANDEVTAASGDAYLDCITEFFNRIRDVLGIDIRVKLNRPEQAIPNVKDGERDDQEEPENA